MTKAGISQIMRTIPLLITIFSLSLPAYAKYSGGTGEPNDPYQIATAEDLMLLGDNPEDYNKHFILTADIDLDPNLPGRKIFERAVIAADANDTKEGFQGIPFTGFFDGDGHTILQLTVNGYGYLGLFGQLESGAEMINLYVVDVNITGSGSYVGGLVGHNRGGTISFCHSTGFVSGNYNIGGLVGTNGELIGGGRTAPTTPIAGAIFNCHSTCYVSGNSYNVGGLVGELVAGTIELSFWNEKTAGLTSSVVGEKYVGGLVGSSNYFSDIIDCYSVGTVTGIKYHVGGLIGENRGNLTSCHSAGSVSGESRVGGLVGSTYYSSGNVNDCYSTGVVKGTGNSVGGLVGWNDYNCALIHCHSTGTVSGGDEVGGLVGSNSGDMTQCYSTGDVSGDDYVGGLAGKNGNTRVNRSGLVTHIPGTIFNCHSTGFVSGNMNVGGLVGSLVEGTIEFSFWDLETSGQSDSSGGIGKTTAEMQTASTFLEAGWDFVDETANGTEDIWKIAEGIGYPCLSWQKYSGGTGEPDDPYQIATTDGLMLLGDSPDDYDKHFILTADIDLDPNLPGRKVFDRAVIAPDINNTEDWFQGTYFTGVFDGNGHTISHLTIVGESYLGLFGQLRSRAIISNLGLEGVDVNGTGWYVGGLVGDNDGSIDTSYSTITVTGGRYVGGLVGKHGSGSSIATSYSTGTVSGNEDVGGLLGYNSKSGRTGGSGRITASFWDMETSGQAQSAGGTGLTTPEMQTAATFLEAGWDFVDEDANGTDDIWWINEGHDYPRLWWELISEN